MSVPRFKPKQFLFYRKVSEKKITDRNLEAMQNSGNENYGYSPEEPKHTEEMAGE